MPESFASVTMLYVNVVIHGVPLKVCVSISFFLVQNSFNSICTKNTFWHVNRLARTSLDVPVSFRRFGFSAAVVAAAAAAVVVIV